MVYNVEAMLLYVNALLPHVDDVHLSLGYCLV